jgi:hypothetical protein
MLRKVRTFLAALLLVPALTLNASEFTTDSGIAVSTARAGWCYVNIGGQWYYWPC